MTPLTINGCFGVLHPTAGRRGVLIVGPLGDEALNSYRSLVLLAEALAASGHPTLRLHYAGEGDSAGADAGLEAWLHTIEDGVAWLHRSCGAAAVTVVGVRIGASLALRASHTLAAVDSFVLLLPIGGRRLLNELTVIAQMTQRTWQTSSRFDPRGWLEANGLRLDRATRDALRALEPGDAGCAAGARVLIVDAPRSPATPALVRRLHEAGAVVEARADDQAPQMLRDSHLARVPHDVIAVVTRWIGELGAPAGDRAGTQGEPAVPTLELGFGVETPIAFGAAGALFGILCTPALGSDAPAVLLANTSANPRFGNARIAVELARRLAALGIASLRMDGAGMGDAAVWSGEIGTPYSDATTSDVCLGVAELSRRFGRPVVVLGVCSGAYHALQAAQCDARVGGLVLINLQRFVWREGDPPDELRRTALRPTAFYLRHIRDPRSWRRLIAADFDVLNLVRVLAMRALRRAIAALDPVIAPVSGGATQVGRVRRAVATLGLRSVPVLYVLGRNDPGREELAAYFGADGRLLTRQPNVTLRILADSDHTLSSAPVRAELIETVGEWIGREFASPAEFHRGAELVAAAGSG